jgi:PadR family transcriptional regulator PadR
MQYKVGDYLANTTQILKGLLEGCILKIVSNHETYGYEICERLIAYGFQEISEGSVYPILIRLEKKKLLYSNMKQSPLGPMRKYYYLTEEGVKELEDFISSWNEIKKNIDNVLEHSCSEIKWTLKKKMPHCRI